MARWLLFMLLMLVVACGDNFVVDEQPSPKLRIVAPETLRVVEGETKSFLVQLADEPERPVAVHIASRDSSVTSVATPWVTLTRENYATGVSVELVGTEDDEDIINDTADVEITARGAPTYRMTATVMDNDLQQIVADASSLTIYEGYTADFTVRLVRRPSSDVMLDVRSSAPQVAYGSPAVLTFSAQNFAQPQRVTIFSQRDPDTVDGTAVISVGDLPGVQSPTVVAHVHDGDSQDLLLSASGLGIYEGDAATFTVALAYDPLSAVSVEVTSSAPDKAAITSSPSLHFDSSNYGVPQTVSLATLEDDDMADEDVTLALVGPASRSVSVKVNDDDEIIVPAQLSVGEGESTTLTVKLANDPGSGGREVYVQVLSGDVTLSTDTLTFYSPFYATGLSLTINGLVDPNSTSNRTAILRVSSPGQTSRDVTVTILHHVPGRLNGSLSHVDSSTGAVSATNLWLAFANPWPGDGQLQIDFPADYDVSGVTLAGSDLDGTLSLVATTSRLVITRANGTPRGTSAVLSFANWRNPIVSSSFFVPIATKTAAALLIDQGTARDSMTPAPLSGATVSFTNPQPGATTSATFTFTTRNVWHANDVVIIAFPWEFDLSNANVIGQSGIDGVLTYSSGSSAPTFVRSGGSDVAGGTTISITVGNIIAPPTDRETASFTVTTATVGNEAIDSGFIAGVFIGCPPVTRTPKLLSTRTFGGSRWAWPAQTTLSWGNPATAMNVDMSGTDLLVADDFGFALPAGATITGIKLDVRRSVTANVIVDSAVRLVKGGAVGQTDRSSSSPWEWWTSASYGGAGDLWGQTWLPADILSGTFGVGLAGRSSMFGVTDNIGVGEITVTVYPTCQ